MYKSMKQICIKKTFEECKQALNLKLNINLDLVNNVNSIKNTFQDFVIINKEVANRFKLSTKENVLLHAIFKKSYEKGVTVINHSTFIRINYKFLCPLWILTPTEQRNEKGETLFTIQKFSEIIKSKSAFYRIKDNLINNEICPQMIGHIKNCAGYKIKDEVKNYIEEIIKSKQKKADESEFGANYAAKKGYKNESDQAIFKKIFELQGGKDNYFYKVKDLLKKINYTKFRGWKFAALTKQQRETLIKKGTNQKYFIKITLSDNRTVYALNLPNTENIKREKRDIICTNQQAIKQIKTVAKKIQLSTIQKNILYFCNKYNYDLKDNRQAESLAKQTRCKDVRHLYTELQKITNYQLLTNKNGVIKTNFNAIFEVNYFNQIKIVKTLKQRK